MTTYLFSVEDSFFKRCSAEMKGITTSEEARTISKDQVDEFLQLDNVRV